MGAEASAVQHSGNGERKRPATLSGAVTFSLGAGALATVTAALASLLVDSVLAKRILWVAVALAVAVGAGVWRAGCAAMTSPPDSGRLPQGSRTSSPR
ncbi:hypothetical protein EAO75_28265 [Streptomyces sp. uw30]|nr:hypothetical protein EAO75_28265 [Streptomyces sp. uw30]